MWHLDYKNPIDQLVFDCRFRDAKKQLYNIDVKEHINTLEDVVDQFTIFHSNLRSDSFSTDEEIEKIAKLPYAQEQKDRLILYQKTKFKFLDLCFTLGDKRSSEKCNELYEKLDRYYQTLLELTDYPQNYFPDDLYPARNIKNRSGNKEKYSSIFLTKHLIKLLSAGVEEIYDELVLAYEDRKSFLKTFSHIKNLKPRRGYRELCALIEHDNPDISDFCDTVFTKLGSVCRLDWRESDFTKTAINEMFKLHKFKTPYEEIIDDNSIEGPIYYHLDIVAQFLKPHGFTLLNLWGDNEEYMISLVKSEQIAPYAQDIRAQFNIKTYFAEIPTGAS